MYSLNSLYGSYGIKHHRGGVEIKIFIMDVYTFLSNKYELKIID